MKRTEKGIVCPNCERVDMLATYRKRQIVEYRNISTQKIPIGGVYGYKANWLKESAKLIGKEGIRCMACQKDLEQATEKVKELEEELKKIKMDSDEK